MSTNAGGTRQRVGAWSRFLRNPLGVTSALVLTMIVLAAVLAPWLMPHDPAKPLLDQVNSAPNSVYWLGGDGSGRDILSRLLIASQLTLLGALAVGAVAILVGVGGGLIAGYLGGWSDAVLTWIYNAVLAVPSIIILVALYAVIGPNTIVTMAAFGILISPILFRLVRTLVISVRRELYVDAAKVSGLNEGRIMLKHVLTAVRAPIIVASAGIAGAGIMIQAGLAFLGLGTPSQATWGGMLQDAFLTIYRAPLNILWPGLAIGVTTASLALLVNALRDALEDTDDQGPKTRKAAALANAYVYPMLTKPDPPRNGEGNEAGAQTALLSIRDLAIGYPTATGEPTVVVDQVSLHLERGEVLGLVGESGSGKTQTSLAILGLLPGQAQILAGQIQYRGRDLLKAPESELMKLRGRHIAYIPQEPMSNLDPTYTIGYQISVPMMRRLGIRKQEAQARALHLLERVGISNPSHTMKSYPHEISGGMAQRVLIAAAVSCDPDLIIADEPTTALDVTVQAEILDLLRDLQKERQLSMLLVTHNFGVVADLCDRVAVMQHGRIIETADVLTLFDHPAHPYTRTLLEASLDEGAASPQWSPHAKGRALQ